MKKFLIILISACLSLFSSSAIALSEEARAKGFVYLSEVDNTILQSVRYFSDENFLGCRVDGYKAPVIILTRQAADALKKVQEDLLKDGYCLVVYDAYRPLKAVSHFVRWGKDLSDQRKKANYYPRIDKSKVFELGYVAERSAHTRGSTVDLTIIKIEDALTLISIDLRIFQNGLRYNLVTDGTVDMGTTFDLFDEASHHQNSIIPKDFKIIREYLKNKMVSHGFLACEDEWWHYTLKNEPHQKGSVGSDFDFDVE